jgi:phytoene synthase
MWARGCWRSTEGETAMVEGNGSDASSEAVVRDTARADDRDRYLAALLAPRSARADLITLTAFLGEIARIPELVNEPMMGEIRLQWWRDILESGRSEASSGSPVADALLDTIARQRLPLEWFHALLEARSRELTPNAFSPEEEDLDSYLDATDGTAFRLAARILAGEGEAGSETLRAAGRAWGRIRLLRGLPAALAKGRSPLSLAAADWDAATGPVLEGARAWLQEARSRLPEAPEAVLPAVLPLALVEPYLKALQRLGPDIARVKADISPLTRVWRLWWASTRRRI